jgi:hypothetical protein
VTRRRRPISEVQLRRATIRGGRGRLVVQRRKRAVRVTAVTERTEAWNGKPSDASFAFVDLDDAGVDRLVGRLQAIRGGRRSLNGDGSRAPGVQRRPGRQLWFVVLQDKELRGEPDVGICLVEGTEEDAAAAGRDMSRAAATAGRARCVSRWREVDPGCMYRATTLLCTPSRSEE